MTPLIPAKMPASLWGPNMIDSSFQVGNGRCTCLVPEGQADHDLFINSFTSLQLLCSDMLKIFLFSVEVSHKSLDKLVNCERFLTH